MFFLVFLDLPLASGLAAELANDPLQAAVDIYLSFLLSHHPWMVCSLMDLQLVAVLAHLLTGADVAVPRLVGTNA